MNVVVRCLLSAVLAGCCRAVRASADADGLAEKIGAKHEILRRDKFHGFDRIVFDFNGHEAWIVCPKGEVRPDRAWTWTMQWASAFVPRTNVPLMLAEGFRHVTIDTFKYAMDETGLKVSADYQRYLVEELDFAPKANLIGMSWGGFFSVRYAAACPGNVAKIYLDAPLLVFTGDSIAVGPWSATRPGDGEWLKHPEMPINKAELVARAGIPVLLLYGGVDQVVPPERNARLFERRFRAAGGDLRVVCRNAYAHHPHGVEESETTIRDFFLSVGVKPVADYRGEVGTAAGWKLVANEEGKVVYIPFEGYYESKGGRIESPRVKLDKPQDENGYYRLTFTAKSNADGYWWVDFFDRDGKPLPDVNSRLYASPDWRNYDVMVPASPDAAEAVIAFVSKKGAAVKDVTMRRADLDEAVEWCGQTYAAGPRLDYRVSEDSWARLPLSQTAIRVGKEFRIVLLGDSIMNDSYCGLLTAIVQKTFPDTKIHFDISVRGSTGCWYYRDEKHFKEYVARYSPDLVVIGGISNYPGPGKQTIQEAEEGMVETINRCKAIGAEVVICTPPPSREFRSSSEPKPFDRSLIREGTALPCLEQEFEFRAARRTGVQIWDLTVGPCEARARSGKPVGWFNRDEVHNDDRGKQLIAQMFGEYFRAALRPLGDRAAMIPLDIGTDNRVGGMLLPWKDGFYAVGGSNVRGKEQIVLIRLDESGKPVSRTPAGEVVAAGSTGGCAGAIAGKWLFVSGGELGSVTVRFEIRDDGTLANRTELSNGDRPAFRQAGMVASGKYLVIAGGWQSRLCYAAEVKPDGSLGSWVRQRPLPSICYCDGRMFRIGRRIYIAGNQTFQGATDRVFSTEVAEDGAVTKWRRCAELPECAPDFVFSPLPGGHGVFYVNLSSRSMYVASLDAGGEIVEWRRLRNQFSGEPGLSLVGALLPDGRHYLRYSRLVDAPRVFKPADLVELETK